MLTQNRKRAAVEDKENIKEDALSPPSRKPKSSATKQDKPSFSAQKQDPIVIQLPVGVSIHSIQEDTSSSSSEDTSSLMTIKFKVPIGTSVKMLHKNTSPSSSDDYDLNVKKMDVLRTAIDGGYTGDDLDLVVQFLNPPLPPPPPAAIVPTTGATDSTNNGATVSTNSGATVSTNDGATVSTNNGAAAATVPVARATNDDDDEPYDRKWPIILGTFVLTTGFPTADQLKGLVPQCQGSFRVTTNGGKKKIMKHYKYRACECSCGFKVRVLRLYPEDDEPRNASVRYWVHAKEEHDG